jgi:CAAX protease family protein
MLADYFGNISAMGTNWLPHFGVYWLLPLIAYRILMTWVYANTKSLLLAQLMHMSYTGWQAILGPTTTFAYNMQWQIIFAAALWFVVAIVAATYGVHLVRQRRIRAAHLGATR